MGSREERDGMLTLLLALMGEKNPIEYMEKKGQEEVVYSTRLAKKMRPSREDWEELGFEFEDIEGDRVLVNAKMPEGWSIRPTDNSYWTEIVDANGLRRGSMFYKAAFYDRDAHMDLEPRYGIRSRYTTSKDGLGETRTIIFGNDQEELFVAGSVTHRRGESDEVWSKKYKKEEALREIAKQWADENYPDWRSEKAYWDKGPTLSQKKSEEEK